MIYDFTFKRIELKKKDFIKWLVNEMIAEGWINLSENKYNVDYYTMFSDGESGKDKIGIQIRPFYANNANYNFETATYGLFSARAFHTYTPNPTLTGAGTYAPNEVFTDIRVSNNVTIDTDYVIHYHINKDRVIVVTEFKNNVNGVSATFFLLGKPEELAQQDEFSKSAVICSHGGYACRSGVINYNTNTTQYTSTFYTTPIPKASISGNQVAMDILISNVTDGIKYRVPNIFYTNYTNSPIKVFTHEMNKNTFTDNEGRKFKVCVSNMTSDLLNADIRSFIIRVE